jgi:hypothetical protein
LLENENASRVDTVQGGLLLNICLRRPKGLNPFGIPNCGAYVFVYLKATLLSPSPAVKAKCNALATLLILLEQILEFEQQSGVILGPVHFEMLA